MTPEADGYTRALEAGERMELPEEPEPKWIVKMAQQIDSDAWVAIVDGRDALPNTMWGLRREWANERARAAYSALRTAMKGTGT